jgi:toxin ParE1/3/4
VRRYLVSREAGADLDGIWDYIAERGSVNIATGFLGKFRESFASIGSSPRAGVNMPELPPGDMRKFPMGNYLIYYRALPKKIVIVRVLHGKRIQGKALRKKT